MKWLPIIILPVLLLAGCTAADPSPADMSASNVPLPPEDVPYEADISALNPGQFGLLGDMVVNGYEVGATVDEDTRGYEPYWLMNRINMIVEEKIVTTDPGEVRAPIPIHWDIFEFVSVSSDIDEDLVYEGYDSANVAVILSGFQPDATRKLVITYKPVVTFNIYLSTTIANVKPRQGFVRAPAGYEDWVVLQPTNIKVSPDSVTPIAVTLNVPKDVQDLPEKWEFWVCVSLADRYNAGTIVSTISESGDIQVVTGESTSSSVTSVVESGNPYRVVMKN